jgi:hypothetical protein
VRPTASVLSLLLTLTGAPLPASLAAQPVQPDSVGTRFVSAGLGLARIEGQNGIAATIGVSFRRGPLVATLAPLDVLVVPKWNDDYQRSGSDERCRSTATGSFVESSLCDARAEYGASAEAGALLGAGATRVWIGGGYVVGATATPYASVTTLFRWGDTPHLHLRLRAGDRYVQGAFGIGSSF